MTLTIFTSGTKAKASEVNANFTEVTKQIENSAITLQITAYESASNFCWLSKLIRVRVNGTDLERTTDGGDNWSVVESSITGGGKFYVNPNDANYVVYYTSAYNGTFVYSTNGGVTFTVGTKPTDADQNVIAYSITDTGRIYAIYDDGGNTEVAWTEDGGSNWTVVTDPTGLVLAANDIINIASPKNACIVFSIGDASTNDCYVGYSLDTGATWTTKSSGGSADRARIVTAQYIDETHYCVDCNYAEGIGISAILWETTNLTDADDSLYNTLADAFNDVLLFTSDYMIINTMNEGMAGTTLFKSGSGYPISIPTVSQKLTGSFIIGTAVWVAPYISFRGVGLDNNPIIVTTLISITNWTNVTPCNGVAAYFVELNQY